MRENTDLKNTEYGHFSCNASFMGISSSFTIPLKHKLKVSVHLLCIFINNFTTLFKCNVSCFFYLIEKKGAIDLIQKKIMQSTLFSYAAGDS